ncbi:Neurotransmitter-gated ion-channel transmembrane region, partial [Ostertagia ostertagi]
MQSYVPTTLIVVISWFSFWLDVDAVPARVSLAITTLLTLSTQANAARMALPEVSYMKAIDVWMGACMMFVFGVMIEFTIVNYAQRQASTPHPTRKPPEGLVQKAHRVFDKFRGRGEHRTNSGGNLLDHVIFNGNMYDTLSGKNSENIVSPRSNKKGAKVDSDVELTQEITTEPWKDKPDEKAKRLANWRYVGNHSLSKQRAPITLPRSTKRGSEPGSEKKSVDKWKQTVGTSTPN